MTNKNTASQLAKDAEKRESERKCEATKKWETARTCFGWVGIIFLILFIGVGVSAWIFPYMSENVTFFTKQVSYKIIITVMVLGIFLFALSRFFDTKLPGYGRFNSSTLIIILALMLSTIVLLIDKEKSEDVVKIIFAVIGFAAGLVAGKEASRSEKESEDEDDKKKKRAKNSKKK